MQSKLYAVSSNVPVFKRRGAEFKDVTIHWFVTDRKAPVVDLRDWINFEKASDLRYSIEAVNELCTEAEANQIKEYLYAVHGDDQVSIEPASAILDNILPWGAIAVGGPSDFITLDDREDFGLPFNAMGYFTVEGCERISAPVQTPKGGAPWKNAPPWKPQASQAELAECFGILREVSYEQSCHDDRLNSMAESIAALEKWADIEYAPVDGKPSNCIHDLIAEGMNLVTTHCMESAAALVTVATAATDKRADAICKQAELLQNLLASTKALLLNVDARLEALENRAPC